MPLSVKIYIYITFMFLICLQSPGEHVLYFGLTATFINIFIEFFNVLVNVTKGCKNTALFPFVFRHKVTLITTQFSRFYFHVNEFSAKMHFLGPKRIQNYVNREELEAKNC